MPEIIKITCPQCNEILWIDKESGEIVKHENGIKKEKKNLDEIVLKEKEKQKKLKEKFEVIKEIEKKKKQELEKMFKKKNKNDS